MSDLQIVEVTWTDHAFHGGEGIGPDAGLAEQQSIGYLVDKTQEVVKLAQSRTTHSAGAETWSEVLVVDRRMVRSIRPIRREIR